MIKKKYKVDRNILIESKSSTVLNYKYKQYRFRLNNFSLLNVYSLYVLYLNLVIIISIKLEYMVTLLIKYTSEIVSVNYEYWYIMMIPLIIWITDKFITLTKAKFNEKNDILVKIFTGLFCFCLWCYYLGNSEVKDIDLLNFTIIFVLTYTILPFIFFFYLDYKKSDEGIIYRYIVRLIHFKLIILPINLLIVIVNLFLRETIISNWLLICNDLTLFSLVLILLYVFAKKKRFSIGESIFIITKVTFMYFTLIYFLRELFVIIADYFYPKIETHIAELKNKYYNLYKYVINSEINTLKKQSKLNFNGEERQLVANSNLGQEVQLRPVNPVNAMSIANLINPTKSFTNHIINIVAVSFTELQIKGMGLSTGYLGFIADQNDPLFKGGSILKITTHGGLLLGNFQGYTGLVDKISSSNIITIWLNAEELQKFLNEGGKLLINGREAILAKPRITNEANEGKLPFEVKGYKTTFCPLTQPRTQEVFPKHLPLLLEPRSELSGPSNIPYTRIVFDKSYPRLMGWYPNRPDYYLPIPHIIHQLPPVNWGGQQESQYSIADLLPPINWSEPTVQGTQSSVQHNLERSRSNSINREDVEMN